MTKKLKPLQRPVTSANLVPQLQSRAAIRAKYICKAEQELQQFKTTVKLLRAEAIALGVTLTEEAKEVIRAKEGEIRSKIYSMAIDQKLDRVMLREVADYKSYISRTHDLCYC